MSENKKSSGAKKAESLARKTPEKGAQEQTKAKKTSQTVKSTANKTAQRGTNSHTKHNNKKQSANEDKKLKAALIKQEKKQKRMEERLAHKARLEEKKAALKLKREERKEKRLERREAMKSKSHEARQEEKKQARIAKTEAAKARREARLNAKIAKREHALKVRAENRKKKQEHAPGFGGWLAAVIALGVSTLALGTMLTFGWINMNGIQADMTSDLTHSVYELNSIVDNLDTNLSKAKISTSARDRAKIFTDIAIESEMAESCIERLPVAGELTNNITAFINKMGDSAQSILYTVASGGELTSSQTATIEYMYKCNKQLKEFLNALTGDLSEKDMIAALKGKGEMFDGFEGFTELSIETPKEIYDGPFAESAEKVSAKDLEGLEEITPSRAEELAVQYFADYGCEQARCTGEAVSGQIKCYNVTFTANGDEYFAQFSEKGGKLVMFDSYRPCNDHNFDIENCITIAENFLENIGYTGMQAVWASENGTTCNLNFAYKQDGAIIYPDIIKVKVCEERGLVTGIEAISYVLNHCERTIVNAELTESQAEEKLGGKLEVAGRRLALIPLDGSEALAYEFYGTYDGNTYYVYLDASTGSELNIFTVIGTAQGKALM